MFNKGNMSNMLKQAQQVQKQIEDVQNVIRSKEIEQSIIIDNAILFEIPNIIVENPKRATAYNITFPAFLRGYYEYFTFAFNFPFAAGGSVVGFF